MGLRRIVLRDFVIVGELDLDLLPGFTAFTGETGAGKSILIEAVQLVTGARADAGTVREGTSRADLSAEFDCPLALESWLTQAGFDRGDTLLVRRTIDQQGKSRGWVNGSPATAAQMRSIGEQLIDIHGQHAWQSLTRPDAVRGLLDAYGRIDISELAVHWQNWRLAAKTLAEALAAQDTLQNERERLAWQIGELAKLAPLANEWEQINVDHARLSNAQALIDAAQGAINSLQVDEPNACSAVNSALFLVRQQQHLEPAFTSAADVLESSLAQLEDTVHALRSYLRKAELEPERLAELDQRISLWMGLAKRFKRAPAELPQLLSGWKDELTRLDAASDVSTLSAADRVAHSAYMQQARTISGMRAKVAPKLSKAITQAMQGLGMEGGRFEVQLQPGAQAMESGLENVQFLVAGHAGSSLRPVGKVASGGELSRLALAIAVTTSQLGGAQTLIFDEVDAGIGGAVAQTVGKLMKRLGKDRQVFAVTHLPQVAACADNHLVVTKKSQGNATLSSVTAVQGESRVVEIARMLGGERILGATMAHAKEMLQSQD